MQLYFSGIELADDFRNLNEYGIGEFSEIVVFLKSINRAKDVAPVKKLCFLVQTSSSLFNGASIPVEIMDSCTISEMREGLQANKTLPRDEYIFVHKQRIMRENCSLRWHGVENGDTLFVFKGSISRGSYWDFHNYDSYSSFFDKKNLPQDWHYAIFIYWHKRYNFFYFYFFYKILNFNLKTKNFFLLLCYSLGNKIHRLYYISWLHTTVSLHFKS